MIVQEEGNKLEKPDPSFSGLNYETTNVYQVWMCATCGKYRASPWVIMNDSCKCPADIQRASSQAIG